MFLKNFRRLNRLTLPQNFFFFSFKKSGTGKSKHRHHGIWHSAHLCVLLSVRSTQHQLWKATQLSQMGFLVTLRHQEHRFLCNQACPRVGGSEYILTHMLLQSNVRIARGPQSDKCELGQKSGNEARDDPGETCDKSLKKTQLHSLKMFLSVNTPLCKYTNDKLYGE